MLNSDYLKCRPMLEQKETPGEELWLGSWWRIPLRIWEQDPLLLFSSATPRKHQSLSRFWKSRRTISNCITVRALITGHGSHRMYESQEHSIYKLGLNWMIGIACIQEPRNTYGRFTKGPNNNYGMPTVSISIFNVALHLKQLWGITSTFWIIACRM